MNILKISIFTENKTFQRFICPLIQKIIQEGLNE